MTDLRARDVNNITSLVENKEVARDQSRGAPTVLSTAAISTFKKGRESHPNMTSTAQSSDRRQGGNKKLVKVVTPAKKKCNCGADFLDYVVRKNASCNQRPYEECKACFAMKDLRIIDEHFPQPGMKTDHNYKLCATIATTPCRCIPRTLPPGRHPNQSPRWDQSGTVLETRPHGAYIIKMDGSGRVSQQTRAHLKPVFVPFSTGEKPTQSQQTPWDVRQAAPPGQDVQPSQRCRPRRALVAAFDPQEESSLPPSEPQSSRRKIQPSSTALSPPYSRCRSDSRLPPPQEPLADPLQPATPASPDCSREGGRKGPKGHHKRGGARE